MESHDEPGDALAERVHSYAKRNLLIVVVLFVSNVVTAVSTLATAWGVLQHSAADWRPAEYQKLRTLRGGHTLERFIQVLGHASYRRPLPDFTPGSRPGGLDKDKLTQHVFRPREDYRVEVIADQSGTTLVYAVTSCKPDFKPWFWVDRNTSVVPL